MEFAISIIAEKALRRPYNPDALIRSPTVKLGC
jgi:hypothetical protein